MACFNLKHLKQWLKYQVLQVLQVDKCVNLKHLKQWLASNNAAKHTCAKTPTQTRKRSTRSKPRILAGCSWFNISRGSKDFGAKASSLLLLVLLRPLPAPPRLLEASHIMAVEHLTFQKQKHSIATPRFHACTPPSLRRMYNHFSTTCTSISCRIPAPTHVLTPYACTHERYTRRGVCYTKGTRVGVIRGSSRIP
jgi:hypothetical protein